MTQQLKDSRKNADVGRYKKVEYEAVLPNGLTFPLEMTIRGNTRGGTIRSGATSTKCVHCGDEIKVAEQYFSLGDGHNYCLGCVKYELLEVQE